MSCAGGGFPFALDAHRQRHLLSEDKEKGDPMYRLCPEIIKITKSRLMLSRFTEKSDPEAILDRGDQGKSSATGLSKNNTI